MRPGRIPVILLQRVLKPFPTPFTTNLRPYVSVLTITSIIVLTGSTTAETVDPYYLKMFPTLLAKCLLQGLLSLSQLHQAVVFPEPPILLLVLLWLDLHSHHQQALDFLNLTSVSLQFVSPSQ